MRIETERSIQPDGQRLHCQLTMFPSEGWLQNPKAVTAIEEIFLDVFSALDKTEPNRQQLDAFCQEVRQAVATWQKAFIEDEDGKTKS